MARLQRQGGVADLRARAAIDRNIRGESGESPLGLRRQVGVADLRGRAAIDAEELPDSGEGTSNPADLVSARWPEILRDSDIRGDGETATSSTDEIIRPWQPRGWPRPGTPVRVVRDSDGESTDSAGSDGGVRLVLHVHDGQPPEPQSRATLLPMQGSLMLFGLNIPESAGKDATSISDADWERFVEQEITPRFPAGITVVNATGQWPDQATGRTVNEPSRVVMFVTAEGVHSDLQSIADAYKERFYQDAVGIISGGVNAAFV